MQTPLIFRGGIQRDIFMAAELWQIWYYGWAPSQLYDPSRITSHRGHTVAGGDVSLRLCKKAETPGKPTR